MTTHQDILKEVFVSDAPSCTSNKTKVVEADLGEETQLDCSMKWGGNLIFTWSKITHLDRYAERLCLKDEA